MYTLLKFVSEHWLYIAVLSVVIWRYAKETEMIWLRREKNRSAWRSWEHNGKRHETVVCLLYPAVQACGCGCTSSLCGDWREFVSLWVCIGMDVRSWLLFLYLGHGTAGGYPVRLRSSRRQLTPLIWIGFKDILSISRLVNHLQCSLLVQDELRLSWSPLVCA